MGQKILEASPEFLVGISKRDSNPDRWFQLDRDGLPEDVKIVRTRYNPVSYAVEIVVESKEWPEVPVDKPIPKVEPPSYRAMQGTTSLSTATAQEALEHALDGFERLREIGGLDPEARKSQRANDRNVFRDVFKHIGVNLADAVGDATIHAKPRANADIPPGWDLDAWLKEQFHKVIDIYKNAQLAGDKLGYCDPALGETWSSSLIDPAVRAVQDMVKQPDPIKTLKNKNSWGDWFREHGKEEEVEIGHVEPTITERHLLVNEIGIPRLRPADVKPDPANARVSFSGDELARRMNETMLVAPENVGKSWRHNHLAQALELVDAGGIVRDVVPKSDFLTIRSLLDGKVKPSPYAIPMGAFIRLRACCGSMGLSDFTWHLGEGDGPGGTVTMDGRTIQGKWAYDSVRDVMRLTETGDQPGGRDCFEFHLAGVPRYGDK